MLRSLLRVGGAIALALLLAPISPSAAPAPGLGYDEIVRVVMNATPPPPGNFQGDLAALTAATPAASAAPRRRGIGLGAIAGAVLGGGGAGAIGGAVAGDAAANAMDAQLGATFGALGASFRSFLEPHLMRYAYYNGWERVDDVATQTAVIRKCDINQVVRLDLAKSTYSVYDPNNEPTPAPAGPAPRNRASAGTPAQPGTAVADFTTTTKSLGPVRMESQTTAGYDSTAAFSISQATGSCRDANASIRTVEYVSPLTRPAVTSCPVRRAPIPQSAVDFAAPPGTGGCRPTMTFHRTGPAIPTGKLSLYSLVTMGASGAATPAPSASGGPSGIGFLTERGNLKTLGATDASLFEIPAGFTKVP